MSFDYKSVLFFLILNNISIIIIFSYLMVVKNLQRWFLIVFLLSKVLHTIGLLGIEMRGIIPDLFSIHFGNFFILISYSTIAISILSYDGKFQPKLSYILIFAAIITFIGRTLLKDNLAYRSVAQASGNFIIYSISGMALLLRKEKLYLKFFIAITFLFFAFFQFFRAYVIYDMGSDYSFFNGSKIDSWFLLISVFVVNITNFGFILLLLEIDEKELSRKNLIIASDREELKILNQTKDKFFSIIAHDLRSPLGTMKELLTTINTDFKNKLDEGMQKIFKVLNESSKNTFALLENLLAWARSQRGALIFNPENININDIIKKNMDLLASSAQDKNIILENKFDNKIIGFVDFSMIDTVIRNLLSNAIKYTSDNGKIILSCEKLDGNYNFSIRDSGIGMSNDTKSGLFNSHEIKNIEIGTKGEKGTGLGLILCKEFVEKHGGKIWAESELGKGSTFYFTIPIFLGNELEAE